MSQNGPRYYRPPKYVNYQVSRIASSTKKHSELRVEMCRIRTYSTYNDFRINRGLSASFTEHKIRFNGAMKAAVKRQGDLVDIIVLGNQQGEEEDSADGVEESREGEENNMDEEEDQEDEDDQGRRTKIKWSDNRRKNQKE
ncbi:hypothetical protein NDU88_004486 [Pleurodeles waltl]|uniref:Uncharacterized protein n=1 Tax=Pleurodeles waltl TaxID=8319 RepID=A0AAV7QIJ0_PLEWA|nr:hypothetical protein NDU88_004486 [Pleurodeles waltl]